MSLSFKLYRLQQIDSQLDRARARLREIDTALSEDQAIRQAKARLQEAEEELRSNRKLLRQAEDAVQEQRLKIEQTEATLYSGRVRNPKELQDMQNEAAALKRYRIVLEDRQLEAMIAVEEMEAVQKTASSDLETVVSQFAKQHSALTQEQTVLLNDIERIENERKATVSSIPDDPLKLYEQLRQQRRGIAVAKVTDKACSACGSTLNAVLLNAARSPNQISRCDICGRILYGG
jgi:predicted  nucleic acid-binding Zn-ribbon protein